MTAQNIKEAQTTTSDGCAMKYTYCADNMQVLSICVVDVMQRMVPATARDREDAQWHLINCV